MFAALLSDRPYRKGFDQQTAVSLMIEEVKNFDMRVFLAFQRMIHEEEIPPVVWLEALPSAEQQKLLEELLFPVIEE